MTRPFTIHLIMHSHVDIGYTERQERIAQYHAGFVRQAIECARVDRRPIEMPTRFKFTCESFWALEQYLHRFPETGESDLVAAIKTGKLELTAFYAHLADLLDKDTLSSSLDFAFGFAEKHQIPITSATAFDINGFPWTIVDELTDRGVKYLSMAINTHHGGPPFGRPLLPFYWSGPSGRSLLVWNGLTYHKANLLGLIPGFMPMEDPGVPGMMDTESHQTVCVQDIRYANERVPQFIEALQSQGYPYDFVPIMGSSLYTDNSPISLRHLDLIENWNDAHGDEIRIKTSTVEEFFETLEAADSNIPTHRGDWNDWWTDGAISTPAEIKLLRNAQRNKAIAKALDIHGTVNQTAEQSLNRALILHSEHTWGHSASHTDPHKLLVNQLEVRKAKFAIDADVQAAEMLDEVAASRGEGEFRADRPFEYAVLDPRTAQTPSVARIGIDFWETDAVNKGFVLVDDKGQQYSAQITETVRGSQILFIAEVGKQAELDIELQLIDTQAVPEPGNSSQRSTFENDYYRVSWDDCGITGLEYVSPKTGNLIPEGCSLGCPTYQIFRGADRREPAGFGYGDRQKPPAELIVGRATGTEVIETGPVFTKIAVSYEIEGTRIYRVFATFYQNIAQIEISVEVAKELVLDPEGLYAWLPSWAGDAQWHVEKQGLMILPGRDQLPGTCCDYFAATSGAASVGDDGSLLVTTLDAPMMTFGGIKLWDYTTEIDPTGHFYSWLTNNKWETNFRTHCAGMYEFRYVLDVGPGIDRVDSIPSILADNSLGMISIRK